MMNLSDVFQIRRNSLLSEEALPVRTKSALDWERLTGPNRFMKKFKFKKRSNLLNFLEDVLAYEDETQHHAQIIVRYKTVTIEVWTHVIKDITDADIDYARMVNEIYKDNNASIDE